MLKNIAFAVDPDQTKSRNVDIDDFLRLEDFKVVWKNGERDTLDDNQEKNKGILFIPQKFLGELLYGKEPKFDEFLIALFENRDDFKNELDSYRKNADQSAVEIANLTREVLDALQSGTDWWDRAEGRWCRAQTAWLGLAFFCCVAGSCPGCRCLRSQGCC